MTPEERIERTEANLDRLTVVVDTLASSVVAHDNQIEAHDRQIDALLTVVEKQGKEIADMARQWQAYINTLPRQ
jgi:uncharacterized coiled-coil protein SlyX